MGLYCGRARKSVRLESLNLFFPFSLFFLLSLSLPDFRVFDEEWNILTLKDLPPGYFLIYLHTTRDNAHPIYLVRTIRYLNQVHRKFPHIIGMVEGYTFGNLSHLFFGCG